MKNNHFETKGFGYYLLVASGKQTQRKKNMLTNLQKPIKSPPNETHFKAPQNNYHIYLVFYVIPIPNNVVFPVELGYHQKSVVGYIVIFFSFVVVFFVFLFDPLRRLKAHR